MSNLYYYVNNMSTNHAARSYPGVFKKKKTMLQDNICNLNHGIQFLNISIAILNSNFDLVSNFQLIFFLIYG